MENELKKRVSALKKKCLAFHEEAKYEIDSLCNQMDWNGKDFKESSRLSHIGDRLDLFIKELTEF